MPVIDPTQDAGFHSFRSPVLSADQHADLAARAVQGALGEAANLRSRSLDITHRNAPEPPAHPHGEHSGGGSDELSTSDAIPAGHIASLLGNQTAGPDWLRRLLTAWAKSIRPLAISGESS